MALRTTLQTTRHTVLPEPQRGLPLTLIHGGHATARYRNAATREPVGRVVEDDVNALRGHQAHQLDAVRQVHHRPRLPVTLQYAQRPQEYIL
jgi:hypothetical protein